MKITIKENYATKFLERTGKPASACILLCGHSHFDLSAYEQYLAGKLIDYEVTQEQINESLAELSTPII